jgi:5-oxopent-3-ene-1,2,5-tricarboxylate decarboxylase/2-hydroxyhepta-2,4-diene-1,7-dioate isomerase
METYRAAGPIPHDQWALCQAHGTGDRKIGTVYGVILNFKQDLTMLGAKMLARPYNGPPKAPVLHIKTPNTFRAHNGRVPMPSHLDTLEVSATLGIVLGRTATRISAAEAFDHVLGYMAALDVAVPHDSFHRPAIRERCRDGFLPLGPIVPRSRVDDPDNLAIKVSVNGSERHVSSTSDLVRSVAELIADVSDFSTLFSGDVLLVGILVRGVEIRVGDQIVAEIESVGQLAATVCAEADEIR